MRRVAVVAALAGASIALASDVGALPSSATSAAAVRGDVRVLVVLATWGPEPFARSHVDDVVFGEANAFVQSSSYGRASLTGTVTDWIRVGDTMPACDPARFASRARGAALVAGYDPGRYDHVIYLHPSVDCPWSGVAIANEIVLDGELYRKLVVHELGHVFGLGHANTLECGEFDFGCVALEYGDPYSIMGSGDGDFNVYEKSRLGWLPRAVRPGRSHTLALGALERPGADAKALVVRTAGEEYWLENRRGASRSDEGVAQQPGVLVRIGPPRQFANGRVVETTSNTLILDPAGRGRAPLLAGDSFAVPGAFTATVVRAGSPARVRFRWTDRAAPRSPRSVAAFDRGARLQVVWDEAHELGSGIAHYEVRINARKPRRVTTRLGRSNALSLPRPAIGRHRIAVVAVDRAGNRSAPALYSFAVAGP